MNQKLVLSVVFILFSCFASAQHQELTEKPETYKAVKIKDTDPRSLLHAFRNGSLNGHFRYFFMTTLNEKGLTDYFANAAGGGIRFETAKFHGFQIAVSGFYIFNVKSSDLSQTDSLTGLKNRYEIGLFDIEDPYNKSDIDRLEEFYLKYNHNKSWIVLGRQLINTPFINLQDGRMRPTGVNGVWFNFNEIKDLSIEGGWIHSITPRGTTRWFKMGESIGVFPSGVNPDGSKSQYPNNIESKGAALLGLKYNLSDAIKIRIWDMYTGNVFNSFMTEADFSRKMKNGNSFFAGLQLIRQDAVKDGGNSDPSKTYFQKGGRSLVLGAKVGMKHKRIESTLAYTRITRTGRYLVPREWGRDPMFTFMPRERNEGLADIHAVVGKLSYFSPRSGFSSSISTGYYKLPDVNDFRFNKYGMPSYVQINADLRYRFNGIFSGLEGQLLIVGKLREGNTYDNPKYVFNKVNLLHTNLLFNFYF